MDKLRQEVLQAQGARSDLLKWKLGLVGVIGAVGLGLSGSHTTRHANLVLCAIPPVCLYVDMLCRHLNLRMMVIGQFLRTRQGSTDPEEKAWAKYEELVGKVRKKMFALESWAVAYSTGAISAAVFVYGILGTNLSAGEAWAFRVSGIVGGLGTLGAGILYERRSVELPTAAS